MEKHQYYFDVMHFPHFSYFYINDLGCFLFAVILNYGYKHRLKNEEIVFILANDKKTDYFR